MLSLAEQIVAAANSGNHQADTKSRINEQRRKNMALGAKAKSEKAMKAYRGAMQGKGWVTQAQIEQALGYAATVSALYIRKLYQRGIIERRNRGGAPKFSRTQGYEYRWIPGN